MKWFSKKPNLVIGDSVYVDAGVICYEGEYLGLSADKKYIVKIKKSIFVLLPSTVTKKEKKDIKPKLAEKEDC